MTRFDRHVIFRILAAFLFFVVALILFFVVLHYVEHSDDFAEGGATLREIFLVYYPHYVPEIIRLISPLGIFLAAVYVTGKMAQELQLVALQTSGVSLYRLMVPYLLIGITLSGFMFWFNGYVVPITNQTVLDMEQEYIIPGQVADISDVHRQNRPGEFLTVGYYDQRDSVGYRVSLQRFEDGGRLTARTDAARMRWLDSLQVWRFEDATERHLQDGQIRRVRTNATIDTTLYIYPRDMARTERDVEAMTIDDAAAHIESLRRSGAGNLGRPMVAYYNKFAYPVANFILVMLSIPLASRRMRGGQALRFGIGLAVAFSYLAIQKLLEPFGYAGTLSPALTAWLPHLLFALITAIMIWRTRK